MPDLSKLCSCEHNAAQKQIQDIPSGEEASGEGRTASDTVHFLARSACQDQRIDHMKGGEEISSCSINFTLYALQKLS